jgi:hypothetical protein
VAAFFVGHAAFDSYATSKQAVLIASLWRHAQFSSFAQIQA